MDSLAILVSAEGIAKLWGVPAISPGIGKAQADAAFELINDWNLIDTVTCMCFDTTVCNTGNDLGAYTMLGYSLGKLSCSKYFMRVGTVLTRIIITVHWKTQKLQLFSSQCEMK